MRARERWALLGLLALIIVIQGVVAAAGDSRVYSGSDAGGRAEAVAAAERNGGCDHDVGYWARAEDEGGGLHPTLSAAVGDSFVQPASIGYVCTASFLGGVFGRAGVLAVSIAGVVFAAIGAWILERASGGSGVFATVLVGVVGSVAFYGTDAWEHAPAVGCVVLGTALLLTRSDVGSGLAAGLLWGSAVALRSETALVAVGLALATVLVGEVRRSLLGRRIRLAVFGAVAGAVLAADRLAQQRIIGSDFRSSRVGTQASAALDSADERVRDAVVTTVGLFATETDTGRLVLGACFVALLLVLGAMALGWEVSSTTTIAVIVLAAVTAFARIRVFGFVPGLFPAAPVAALGALVAVSRVSVPPVARVVSLGSLLAMPAVWALQWQGDFAPQWGSRYLLSSAALLTIAGAAVLARRPPTIAGSALVVLALVVGASGLVWHVERTQRYGDALDELATLSCDDSTVVVSTSKYFIREFGSSNAVRSDGAASCRFLTASSGSAVSASIELAEELGAERVLVLRSGRDAAPPPGMPPSALVGVTDESFGPLDFTGFTLDLSLAP